VTITRGGSWALFLATLFIVAMWPPDKDHSLVIKAVHWGVDPADRLPILPPQLGFGLSDDVQAVEIRDEMVRRYDVAFNSDSVTRWRLKAKVVEDPFNQSTERQLLLVFGVVVAFLALKR
jgi:hypothetical protein